MHPVLLTSMHLSKFVSACGAAAAAVLIAAAPASARIIELGASAVQAAPSCPSSPCQAISRTTGYQARIGTQRDVFVAPTTGRVVAWTVTLGKPGTKQRQFFDTRLGGKASANITVMRMDKKLNARIVSQSPVEQLEPYFGQTVQFPLRESLYVRKGYVVAITVPTWAPILSLGQTNDTAWRASRRNKPADKCLDTETQTAQTVVGALGKFQCIYRTARLTYSATMITYPDSPEPE
jgi:hypothetical protein